MKTKSTKSNNNGVGPSINIINQGTIIEGELKANGDIRIDGTLSGIVRSEAKVIVGTSGEINGDIHCKSAEIHGTVNGSVNCKEILFLKTTCHINGDIVTGKLVIESGAEFNGNCSMGNAEPVKKQNETVFSFSKIQPQEASA